MLSKKRTPRGPRRCSRRRNSLFRTCVCFIFLFAFFVCSVFVLRRATRRIANLHMHNQLRPARTLPSRDGSSHPTIRAAQRAQLVTVKEQIEIPHDTRFEQEEPQWPSCRSLKVIVHLQMVNHIITYTHVLPSVKLSGEPESSVKSLR